MSSDLRYAYLAVIRRWARNSRSVAAVAIGAATVAVAVGLTQTSAYQLAGRLAEFDAQTITAILPGAAWDRSDEEVSQDLRNDPNIRAIGTFDMPDGASSNALKNLVGGTEATAPLVIATNAGLEARGSTLTQGATLPDSRVLRADPNNLLIGARLARELGIDMRSGLSYLEVNGVRMRVSGVVKDSDDASAVSAAIVLHPESAAALGLLPESRSILIALDDAVVETVAAYLPIALYPSDPESVGVSFPPSPKSLTESLIANSAGLVNLLTAIMTVVTAFSVMTTMGIAVMERRREIGVGRALGMSRSEIGRRFLLEAAFVGAVGSTVGLLAGVLISATASVFLGWTFVLPPLLLLVPAAGTLVGAISGAWPAWQATRVDPAELLRA